MAEYIERGALLAEIANMTIVPDDLYDYGIMTGVYAVKKKVAGAPAADVAPVVRCKDCKYWKKGGFMGGYTPDSLEYGGGCPLVRFARYESDFCSKGERKDGDGNG